ncbi:MAG TPA: phosphate propanoyltransferase [Candidatus Pelethocola excrementipullorum]|nr:phosphate propanoyltransferase [Candidatus Pelethocola excrementipullorum]
MNLNVDALADIIVEAINVQGVMDKSTEETQSVPLGISNRHIHLSEEDLKVCFGDDYQLTSMKDLSQPGQFACKETVTICGSRGAIEKVRVLGPVRKQTQVEVLAGDCFKLGVSPCIRLSGELEGSAPITVIGPKGSVYLRAGAIVAQRHIHMSLEDAKRFGVRDGQVVSIQCEGKRGGIYDQVLIRANDTSALECHLDIDEANAMQLSSSSIIKIIK